MSDSKNGDASTVQQPCCVPKKLYEKMTATIICIKDSPVRYAGKAYYKPGMFGREMIDELVKDINAHNAVLTVE